MSGIPPIHRELLVDAGPEMAFEVFTARIGAWWPLAGFSVHGEGATVSFTDGRLVERSPAGDEAVWGTVTSWDPPQLVAFTWHPGSPPDRASSVMVSFAAAGDQTLVTLEHSGWETLADPAAARAEYEHGWPEVLERYREGASRAGASPADGDGMTWVALVHRRGPDVPEDQSVYTDPRFGQHIEFLNRMRERGYLVAAGPLSDEPGTGMAILRLPGSDRVQDVAQLATQDDLSVVGGLFTVTIQPWQVMLEA
jgi:uncharacterized protein YndB with AHSA1/START domain/uncharacterized protein YciI